MWEVRANGMERVYRCEKDEYGLLAEPRFYGRVFFFFIRDLINGSQRSSKRPAVSRFTRPTGRSACFVHANGQL